VRRDNAAGKVLDALREQLLQIDGGFLEMACSVHISPQTKIALSIYEVGIQSFPICSITMRLLLQISPPGEPLPRYGKKCPELTK
jgi:hypothetical protein